MTPQILQKAIWLFIFPSLWALSVQGAFHVRTLSHLPISRQNSNTDSFKRNHNYSFKHISSHSNERYKYEVRKATINTLLGIYIPTLGFWGFSHANKALSLEGKSFVEHRYT